MQPMETFYGTGVMLQVLGFFQLLFMSSYGAFIAVMLDLDKSILKARIIRNQCMAGL